RRIAEERWGRPDGAFVPVAPEAPLAGLAVKAHEFAREEGAASRLVLQVQIGGVHLPVTGRRHWRGGLGGGSRQRGATAVANGGRGIGALGGARVAFVVGRRGRVVLRCVTPVSLLSAPG